MSATVGTRGPRTPDPILGPTRFPRALPGWDDVVVTALVPAPLLGSWRSRRPGETVRAALAIADHEVRPAFVGADRWRTDRAARVDARGTVGRLPGEPRCSPGFLEVRGRRWPLAVGVDVRPGTRLEVAGLLHVAPDAAPYARRWTIRAWRRAGRDTVVELAEAVVGNPA